MLRLHYKFKECIFLWGTLMNLYESCSTMTVELIDYIQNNPQTVYHMDKFLSRYQNAIFNFIRLTIHDYHDSLDLTNRVLLVLSKKVKEIRIKKSFNYLALKVIKGELSNYWKGRKTKKAQLIKQATILHNEEPVSLVETLDRDDGQAEEILNLLFIRDIIENATDDNMKKIFFLRYRDDESIEKISQKLQITEYQVKKYLQEIHITVKSYM